MYEELCRVTLDLSLLRINGGKSFITCTCIVSYKKNQHSTLDVCNQLWYRTEVIIAANVTHVHNALTLLISVNLPGHQFWSRGERADHHSRDSGRRGP